jgi:hypothetical protein
VLRANDAASRARAERLAKRIERIERELAYAELLLPEEEPLTLHEVADKAVGMAMAGWSRWTAGVSRSAQRLRDRLLPGESADRSLKLS